MQKHFDVTVLAPSFADCDAKDDLDVRRYPYFWPRSWQKLAHGHGMPTNLKTSKLALIQAPSLMACQSLNIRKTAREPFDLVNSHWLVPQGLCFAMARSKLPHVVTVHGGDINILSRVPGGHMISKKVAKHTNAFIVVGSELTRKLEHLIGTPFVHSVRPMGYDPDMFFQKGPVSTTPHFLYVGRLVESKGPQDLLRAFANLKHQIDGHVSFIGDGPLAGDLKREASELGISSRVAFLGRQEHATVATAISSCTALIVPSRAAKTGVAEGFPTVIMEGLAGGAVVIASDVGSISDVLIHGKNALLFDSRDVQQLTSLLSQAARDELTSIRDAAARTAAKHTWESIANHYSDVFESVWAKANSN
ncbi:MAG: glycosyltransferase [Acidobacteria bacterium]|nr:glycosyltransferase [Acidobacteriota bacterium]